MLVLTTISLVLTPPFERSVFIRMIHAHKADADWIASAFLKLFYLPNQISDHSINLLYHCFRKNLRLSSNFNRRNCAPCYKDTLLNNRDRRWDYFTECSITSSRGLSNHDVAQINNSFE